MTKEIRNQNDKRPSCDRTVTKTMEPFIQSDSVEVRHVPNRGRGGRGVFARRNLYDGEVIERVPAIIIPNKQVFGESPLALRACRISWYVFRWGVHGDQVALPLGYGSLYNHSFEPNAMFRIEMPDTMVFVVLTNIRHGEEITVNYNGDPKDDTPVGFAVET